MNKLLGVFGIWGVIIGTINLYHGVEYPVPSMICLGLSIWITISSLNELDKNSIKEAIKEHFKNNE